MLLNPAQARALLADALTNHYAVLAVNADSPAAVYDCLEAARECDAPIIVETSLWQLQGRSFGAGDPVLGAARYLADLTLLASAAPFADVPVIFHTDHIKGPATMAILQSVIAGIPFSAWGEPTVRLRASTVSLDSSALSAEDNVAAICALCEFAQAHDADLVLEMEAGVDDGLTPNGVTERLLGSVEARFPGRIALWAPGLGTRHGVSEHGYPEFSAGHAARQVELARRVTGRQIGLALHGSSGLAEESLRDAVAAGVVKVNWSSESLVLRSAAAREYHSLHADRLETKHKLFKETAMDNGLQSWVARCYVPRVAERIRLLSGAGCGRSFLHTLSL